MRIGVVDDERPARSEMMYLLRSIDPTLELVEASCAEEILQENEELALDGCFLDINLNGMNGTTLGSLLKRSNPHMRLVFATAYPDYAVRAFELGALDYILKPYELDRVQEALDRMRKAVQTDQGAAKKESEEEGMLSEESSELKMNLHKILVQGRDSMRILNAKEIIYIETENRVCSIYTAKESFTSNQSLNYFEKRLAGEKFFRIHKSYLVNLSYMKELIPYYNNGYGLRMMYHEKTTLPVGRQQIRQLRAILE